MNSRQGYTGDEDSVGCILSFVSSLAYRTDHETGHSSSYPRTPAVILAEEVGDSEDHTLLAAALMRELGYGIAILYYPATYDRLSLIPEAAALGLSTGEDHHGPAVYASRENSTQRAVISPFWTVNTEEQGIPTAAYNGISPIVYTDDSLWTGKMYQPGSGTILDLTNILQFKDSNELLYTPKDWQQNVSDYYRSVWYSTGVSWTLDDTWKVYEKIVAIEDIPGDLYTPWGTAVHNASVPWRLTYTVSKMDEDSVQDMTPYSDVRIAVCSLDPASGSITPIRVSGWQGLYRADKYQTIGPFAPGTYVIGVLVRNAEIKIALEYHGKQNSTAYLGGI